MASQDLEQRVTLLEYKLIRINLVIAFMIGKCDRETQREASRLLEEVDRKAGVSYAHS